MSETFIDPWCQYLSPETALMHFTYIETECGDGLRIALTKRK